MSMPHGELQGRFDAIVVGSGFGGAMAALPLVHAGWRVLMLERGGWVARGPDNWGHRGAGLVTPHYTMESPYHVSSGRRRYVAGTWQCVGGQSVFYGGASFRYRVRDFEPDQHIVGESGADWPFRYEDLEPWYGRVERLLGVAGERGVDPTEPPASTPYPWSPSPLSRPSRAIADAALRLGLRPFRIPLAISHDGGAERRRCIRCGTCDGYACAAEAKNDIATAILPSLVARGLVLRPNTVCVRLLHARGRVTAVECIDRVTRERARLSADCVILAAGALATPHLLLASGLDRASPAPGAVGRYLTRHRNAVVFGLFARRPNPDGDFDKQVAVHDAYFGGPLPGAPGGPLGGIQQLTPPAGLVRAYLPPLVSAAGAMLVAHTSGLLAMAEDQPRRENGVDVDDASRDRFGMPRLHVRHDYSARDRAASRVLATLARRVLREAGASLTWTHHIETFTHALGTVRMGPDERTSPLDGDGRYRGIENLYVADGSALPRAAGVNPSLTIAAVALRTGARLAGTEHAPASGTTPRALPIYHSPLAHA
jgi:choline dehydrogenase-like flavoprotein